jgi:chromosome partitioning protein
MSISEGGDPIAGPHVVVVGNHKGGCGKSTLAMHVIVALLDAGKRVASFDLDARQQTLTHYVENRRAWARRHDLTLLEPRHCTIADWNDEQAGEADPFGVAMFSAALARLRLDYDFIVIDTPSGDPTLSVVAHGLADTLITPINDSFLDLDAIVAIGPPRDDAPRHSPYARSVAAAKEARRGVCGRATDWVVVRNRLSRLASRNERQVGKLIGKMAPQLGFRVAPGLSEREVFREYFPIGVTAFDRLDEMLLGARPSMAHLMARTEVRALIEAIGLLARDRPADQAQDPPGHVAVPVALICNMRTTGPPTGGQI